MDSIEKIEKLLKKRNGVITTSEVENTGINSRILTRMIERGIIERVARGVYISADTIEDTYFTTQAICRKGETMGTVLFVSQYSIFQRKKY